MKKEQLSPFTIIAFFLILNREETASSDIEVITHILAVLFAVCAVAYPRLRTARFHEKQNPPAAFLNPSESNVIMVQDIKERTSILTSDAFMIIDSDGRLYSLSNRLGRSYALIRISSVSKSGNTTFYT